MGSGCGLRGESIITRMPQESRFVGGFLARHYASLPAVSWRAPPIAACKAPRRISFSRLSSHSRLWSFCREFCISVAISAAHSPRRRRRLSLWHTPQWRLLARRSSIQERTRRPIIWVSCNCAATTSFQQSSSPTPIPTTQRAKLRTRALVLFPTARLLASPGAHRS